MNNEFLEYLVNGNALGKIILAMKRKIRIDP